MKFDAVIFDLDGVITKTALVHGAAWKRMFDEYLRSREERFGTPFKEFTHTDDYLPYVDGKPRYQGVASFLESREISIPFGDPSDPPDAETVCGLGNRKNFLFNAVLEEEGVEVYPASVDFIKALRKQGIHTGVASSSKNCKPVLEKAGLLDLFEVRIDGVVSAEIGLKGKPEPDIFTTAADRMGVSYYRSVVVEDAVSGVQAGRKGNFGLVIGVAREGNASELKNNGADIVVEDLGEINIDVVNNWFEEGISADTRTLSYYDYDMEKERSREALLAVGNGYFGTRGAMEESTANKVNYPATYFAGLYNRRTSRVGDRDVENEDFVNAINWLPVTFRIDEDPWFSFTPEPSQKILRIDRNLDLTTGILTRNMVVEDHKGRRTRLFSARTASMDDPHLGGLSYAVTPLNYSEKITVKSGLTADHINAGVERYSQLDQHHLKPVKADARGDQLMLEAITTTSQIKILTVAHHSIDSEQGYVTDTSVSPDKVFLTYTFEGEKGKTITLEKRISSAISIHTDFAEFERKYLDTDRLLPELETITKASVNAWEKIYDKADLRIGENRMVQKLVRLHTYHMFVTASPHTAKLDVGIPPRGLHGEAYRGHIFWDELYFFPFLLLHYPEIPRGMMMYRYRRLDQARAYAKDHGYKGAMFPWQSGSDGREETQVVHLNPVSGEWGDDYSSLQRHVSIAVGYNLCNYFSYTGDMEFMEKYGAEILLEICRFWASACHYDKAKERYHISKVMGPDEFHEKLPDSTEGGFTDNAYTNIMTHWLLDKGIQMVSTLPPNSRKKLFDKIAFNEKETEDWANIKNKLNLSISPEGIIEQFEGYFGLEELDMKQYREKYGDIHRMDRILKAEGKSPSAYKIIKQADLLMVFYLLGEKEVTSILKKMDYTVPEDYVARNFDYYLARTSHGSTLSRLVHSALSFQLGYEKEGWQLFMETLKSDLEDIQGGTTGEGIHCGVMGGTLYEMIHIFGGFDIFEDSFNICPYLPANLSSLSLNFAFRQQNCSLFVNGSDMEIFYKKGPENKIKFHLCSAQTELKKGKPLQKKYR